MISTRLKLPVDRRRMEYFPLTGGLNLVDPPIKMGPGFILGAQNYELDIEGGYRRIDGFERFDGRNRPSQANYWVLNFDAGTTAISEGDLIGDAASPTIQCEALIDAVVSSGSWAGNDAAGYAIVTEVSGKTSPASFSDDDDLYVGAATVAVVNVAPVARGASTDANDTTWLHDAVTTTKGKIEAVPGSGVIRGVHIYNSNVYAFRDNSGGTACVMHKASTAGWVEQGLGEQIDFDAGTTAFTEDDTLTGGTSAATATIERIIVQSGTWGGNDAAGYLILSGVADGPFQNNETITDGAGGSATADGVNSAITLSAGGRYEFITENFLGSSATIRMYGVDGVNKAFEWDGTVFVPLRTGMTTDTPTHIEEHKKHLFLTFAGGSVQNSDTGDPYNYTGRTGAAEFGTGYETVGMHGLPGGILGIWDRNRTYLLYGTGTEADGWVLKEHSDRSGALEWSIQRIGNPIYIDDRGITDLTHVQAFGDFSDNVLAQEIRPLIQTKKNLTIASTISREKNQYRVFFSDGTSLWLTFSKGKVTGVMPIDFGDTIVHCTTSEEISGRERIFFGASDGFIYEMDSGTSFDGVAIPAFLRIAFWHFKSPEVTKRFHKVTLEIAAEGSISMKFTPDFDYSSADIAQARSETLSITGGGGFWNVDDWNDFTWSEAEFPLAEAPIDGAGVNLGFLVNSDSIWEAPHTIYGATVHYSKRRPRR